MGHEADQVVAWDVRREVTAEYDTSWEAGVVCGCGFECGGMCALWRQWTDAVCNMCSILSARIPAVPLLNGKCMQTFRQSGHG